MKLRTNALLTFFLGLTAITAPAAVTIFPDVPNPLDQFGNPLAPGTSAALVVDINGDGLQPDTGGPLVIIDNSGTTTLGGDLVVALTSANVDPFFGDVFINFNSGNGVTLDLTGPLATGQQYYVVWFPGVVTTTPGADPGTVIIPTDTVPCRWATNLSDWMLPVDGSPSPPPGAGGGLTVGTIGHVPEPSHTVLLLAGGLALLGIRRRS
ncbi:MAG: PEP-CTERM sorting domain-containing protein [Akkermansiaceae bacterium]|nr:PEP-CTERM sorting domain-containing protein [Akkermansiaceae bacterium]NNM31069.1 PEP-CTERM sorting domain-containing protein [Akkermansiaceae bacterium]